MRPVIAIIIDASRCGGYLGADELCGVVKLLEGLRGHLDRREGAAVVAVARVQLALELVQLRVQLYRRDQRNK